MTLEELRYPTGKWIKLPNMDAAARRERIEQIASVPAALGAAVKGLTDAQLDTPYRDDGWTTRQIVHHLADSHMNAFIRVKLGVTEDTPTIKPYEEAAWAKTTDSREVPIAASLSILEGLHARWTHLMRSMDAAAFERMVLHPERGPMSLGDMLGLYAWHGNHHPTQITQLRARSGW
jgi:hypothetical protein